MKGSSPPPRLYTHRCTVCGSEWRTPFPPQKGIQVHCTACYTRLRAGETVAEIRKNVKKAANEYLGTKRTLYNTLCTACGKSCRVPFIPLEGETILCRSCYRAGRNTGDGSCES